MNVSLKNKVKEHLIMLYRITLVLGTTTLLFVVFPYFQTTAGRYQAIGNAELETKASMSEMKTGHVAHKEQTKQGTELMLTNGQTYIVKNNENDNRKNAISDIEKKIKPNDTIKYQTYIDYAPSKTWTIDKKNESNLINNGVRMKIKDIK